MGGGLQDVLEHFFALMALAIATGRTVIYAAWAPRPVPWIKVSGIFVRCMFIATLVCLILYFVCLAVLIRGLSGLVW